MSEKHKSHYCCWEQNQPPACGIARKHRCCICEAPIPHTSTDTDILKGAPARIRDLKFIPGATDLSKDRTSSPDTEKGWELAVESSVKMMCSYRRTADQANTVQRAKDHNELFFKELKSLKFIIATEITRARNTALEEAARAIEDCYYPKLDEQIPVYAAIDIIHSLIRDDNSKSA